MFGANQLGEISYVCYPSGLIHPGGVCCQVVWGPRGENQASGSQVYQEPSLRHTRPGISFADPVAVRHSLEILSDLATSDPYAVAMALEIASVSKLEFPFGKIILCEA
ncbi:hypothetical protein MTR67_023531 [Solanum verrucosum]|uniref:Uncharacterized protein n=1 Tax=Solanum verrucosum TaxID=315347 RepID=A0AAF0R176_SOLVR|nr:hypothetical protein MTR67_023531 [Solanum verrucosum]